MKKEYAVVEYDMRDDAKVVSTFDAPNKAQAFLEWKLSRTIDEERELGAEIDEDETYARDGFATIRRGDGTYVDLSMLAVEDDDEEFERFYSGK